MRTIEDYIQEYRHEVGDYLSPSCRAWYAYWGYRQTEQQRAEIAGAIERGTIRKVRVSSCEVCGADMLDCEAVMSDGGYVCGICGNYRDSGIFERSGRVLYEVLKVS